MFLWYLVKSYVTRIKFILQREEILSAICLSNDSRLCWLFSLKFVWNVFVQCVQENRHICYMVDLERLTCSKLFKPNGKFWWWLCGFRSHIFCCPCFLASWFEFSRELHLFFRGGECPHFLTFWNWSSSLTSLASQNWSFWHSIWSLFFLLWVLPSQNICIIAKIIHCLELINMCVLYAIYLS